MNRMSNFIRGIRHGIPIFLGYLAVSFTFGITASDAGLTIFESVLISATNLTSAGQFAGSSSVPAHVEMMGLIGAGNNPMVGMTEA